MVLLPDTIMKGDAMGWTLGTSPMYTSPQHMEDCIDLEAEKTVRYNWN